MSKRTNQNVTVVIPVYADWPSLSQCLQSLQRYLDKRHPVLIINDNGPEADELERNIKKTIAGRKNYQYHRNYRNLGFIKTCNKAVFELDKSDNDVLLLNSDTEVTEGFLEEMTSVLASSATIAAVSPRTNNATIATIPLSAIKQKGIAPNKSYQLFQKVKENLPRYSEVPTAHGFCMLIRRSVISQHGLFDEVFGKGYSEEVDFCQRVKKHGYKSVLSNWAYVFHQEARSFSLEKKSTMLEKNGAIIRQRYPSYQQEVRDYIKQALWQEEAIKPTRLPARNWSARIKKISKRLFIGNVAINKTVIPKLTLAGIGGVVLMYLAIAGVISTTTPWLKPKYDALRHVDYIWRLYSDGEIPKFSDGIQYKPFQQLAKNGKVYPIDVQPAASNPPLFYIIHAPFVGPLLAAGKPEKAVAVGRGINIIIGTATLLVLAWAGWLMGGRRHHLMAVTVPAFGVLTYSFVTLNLNFSVDVLVTLLASLSLVFSYKLLQLGLRPKYVIGLAGVSLLGMATKATFIVFVATGILAIFAGSIVGAKKNQRAKQFLKAGLLSLTILVVIAIAIGWFYYFNNYKTTGSFFSQSAPGYLSEHRRYKNLERVLRNDGLWGLLYRQYSALIGLSTFMTGFAVAGFAAIAGNIKFKKLINSRLALSTLTFLALAVIGIFLTQIVHAVGYGGFQFRYLLPLVLPLGLFLSYGLLEFRWPREGLIAAGFAVAVAFSTFYFTFHLTPNGWFAWPKELAKKAIGASEPNGVPEIVPLALLTCFGIGVILFVASLLWNRPLSDAKKN